eukprot:7079943-Prymnesium_polylepis.1
MAGAAEEDERRREELKLLKNGGAVSDEELFESFRGSVTRPDGFMRRYISRGQLAAFFNGTLYVHGGVIGSGFENDETHCVGIVPGREGRIDDVAEWVAALNEWKEGQVDECPPVDCPP